MASLGSHRLRLRLETSALVSICLLLGSLAAGCGAGARSAIASPAELQAAPSSPEAASGALPAAAPASDKAPAAEAAGGIASSPPPSAPVAKTAAPGMAAPNATPGSADKLAKSGDGPKLDDASKPLLIYEGALGMEVVKSDFPSTIEHAIDIAESLGGYLVSRSDTGAQIRVPSSQFRDAMKEIGKLGSVTRRSVSAQDVSEEFHDLGVRLKNLEAVRDRFQQFLARANNVDEAMRVEKELDAVVLQIDQIKGRMQFLKTRASYSLINLALTPKPETPVAVKQETKPPPPPPPQALKMPVGWLHRVGLDKLLDLGTEN